MMNFRRITAALTQILGDAAAGRFTVTGYQRGGRAASEVKNNKRSVVVFYQAGDFPKSKGRAHGATHHDLTLQIGLSVSAAAKVDLDTINKPNATPAQISTALAAMRDATYEADTSLDELTEIVYQILMDGRNVDMGLPIGTVVDRWVGHAEKSEPITIGSLVELSATMTFTCSAGEDVVGDEGVPADEGFDIALSFGDALPVAGVISARRAVIIDERGQLYDAATGAQLYDAATGKYLTI